MFFDEARVFVQAGHGGNGVVAFRREKYVPRGGPAGGHGGRGGDVILEVDPQHNTLVHFKKRSHFRAGRGGHGAGKNMTGASGQDLVVPVPPGTVVRDSETGELIADFIELGERAIVARGGSGGRGNSAFKSSTNQAPRIAERGLPGEERWINLELKLIADVGIVGMPNAGKSTLLAAVSAARPKIADYPFTTLQPNLGTVLIDGADFVAADIPGLIEGAHQGAGLGHQFLRHVERTRLLIHLLNGAVENPLAEFQQINQELALFSQALANKPQILVLNKLDLPDTARHWPAVENLARERNLTVFQISAVTGQGVKSLLWAVVERLAEIPRPALYRPEEVVFTLDESESFTIEPVPDGWRVRGRKVEQLAYQTYWEHDDAVRRTHGIFEGMGVIDALREAGARPGDTIYLGEVELEWAW